MDKAERCDQGDDLKDVVVFFSDFDRKEIKWNRNRNDKFLAIVVSVSVKFTYERDLSWFFGFCSPIITDLKERHHHDNHRFSDHMGTTSSTSSSVLVLKLSCPTTLR